MNYLKLLVIVCASLIMIGCNKDEMPNYTGENSENVDFRQVIKTTTRTIFPCDANSLTISIDECLETPWVNGIMDAVNEFNSLNNIEINISILSAADIADGAVADIPIDCSDAECEGPFVEVEDDIILPPWIPFNSISIGTATPDQTIELASIGEIFKCCNPMVISSDAQCFFKGVVMHEIMHHLGFAHDTDFIDGVDPSFEIVDGTPLTDPESIMEEGQGCTQKCTFSEFDLIALEELYGACKCPEESGPCECPESDNYDPCQCAPDSYNLNVVPGQELCIGSKAKLFIQPVPPQNINPIYSWTFNGPISGTSQGASATILGVSSSPFPSGVCVTINTDCGSSTICENVIVFECD